MNQNSKDLLKATRQTLKRLDQTINEETFTSRVTSSLDNWYTLIEKYQPLPGIIMCEARLSAKVIHHNIAQYNRILCQLGNYLNVIVLDETNKYLLIGTELEIRLFSQFIDYLHTGYYKLEMVLCEIHKKEAAKFRRLSRKGKKVKRLEHTKSYINGIRNRIYFKVETKLKLMNNRKQTFALNLQK